jgi:hypothetical protein
MVIDPSNARPGDVVELNFPQLTARGVCFVLERLDGDDWEWTHFLISGDSAEPRLQPWYDRDEEWGCIDIRIDGPGPDGVTLPANAEPGDYRFCTANAITNFCSRVEILD